MKLDTVIDDIVEGVVRILQHIPSAHFAVNNETADLSAAARVPYQIYNIGNNQPVALLKFIEILEETPVGEMIVVLDGNRQGLEAALQELKASNLQVKILKEGV